MKGVYKGYSLVTNDHFFPTEFQLIPLDFLDDTFSFTTTSSKYVRFNSQLKKSAVYKTDVTTNEIADTKTARNTDNSKDDDEDSDDDDDDEDEEEEDEEEEEQDIKARNESKRTRDNVSDKSSYDKLVVSAHFGKLGKYEYLLVTILVRLHEHFIFK